MSLIFWACQRIAGALSVAVVLAPVFLEIEAAQAQTLLVLYSFNGSNYSPGGLVRDPSGNFYGMNSGGTYGAGAIFKLDTTGKETELYSFEGQPDGSGPTGLVRDSAGNLYGTTYRGGAHNLGTVFKLDTTNHETVLYSFSGPDGAGPVMGMLRDASGNLYGTTEVGGAHGLGTVYKLDATNHETVLYSFSGPDGEYPASGLVLDASGNLYGTASNGGAHGFGTVFKLDTTNHETVLYSFSGKPDGANPYALTLVRDASGNLYGMTQEGGALNAGVVFELDASGKETVLHSFSGRPNGDGALPGGSLFRDSSGNLYGTTLIGGSGDCLGRGIVGCGIIFKLTPTGTETVLHNFSGPPDGDGADPGGALIEDASGNLYGATSAGGAGICYGLVGLPPAEKNVGCGTVFKLEK
jgi:uncharacterized repeat protein (TIGR03803 family)